MENDILKLDAVLSLTEDEASGVVISQSAWDKGLGAYHLTLVGRLLSHRTVHFEALRGSLAHLIQATRGMALSQFDEPLAVNLDWSPFFVHIHDLPYGQHTLDVIVHIGTCLGSWLHASDISRDIAFHETVHIHINLYMMLPLKRALRLCSESGEEMVVRFPTNHFRISVTFVESWATPVASVIFGLGINFQTRGVICLTGLGCVPRGHHNVWALSRLQFAPPMFGVLHLTLAMLAAFVAVLLCLVIFSLLPVALPAAVNCVSPLPVPTAPCQFWALDLILSKLPLVDVPVAAVSPEVLGPTSGRGFGGRERRGRPRGRSIVSRTAGSSHRGGFGKKWILPASLIEGSSPRPLKRLSIESPSHALFLDRAVACDARSELFPAARVLNLPTVYSDHTPILIQLKFRSNSDGPNTQRVFRFEAFWTRSAECDQIVSDVWSQPSTGTSGYPALECLTQSAEMLTCWNYITYRTSRKRIKWLEDHLWKRESQQLSSTGRSELIAC
ncbi:hypothetical protein Salat_2150000 [Sesamum alatum]|uniref:Endonuclease/exonuclease/phosphatase domain-containing protein n=1 Tax=Sesamum alatum TaxID=300844 RepID=A0AAE1Y2P2_9LAMI|nr:hypothetical protein Salat_2150000 [Sesamum alatum]